MKRWLIGASAQEKDAPKKKKFDDKMYDKEKRERHFQNNWTEEFSWLGYDKDSNVMFCSTCRKFPQLSDPKSILVTGLNNFRKDPLYKHQKSTPHVACQNKFVKTDSNKTFTSPSDSAIGKAVRNMHGQNLDRMRILFNTAYGLIKNAKPFTDFPLLLEIQEKNGLVIGENYKTNKYAQIISSCIAKSIKQETVNLIKQSDFITILSDGSTDTTIVEQEVVYLRFLEGGKIVTTLASLEPLEMANAEVILSALFNSLENIDIKRDDLKPEIKGVPTLVSCNFDGV